MKRPHIIAIGGQAFAKRSEKPFFEEYILRQTKKKNPRILFIGTATGDTARYIANFYATFSRLQCRPSHLPLFERTPDLRKTILTQDAIFVGGGNTKSMLAVWRDWDMDELLHEAWKKGIVMSGVSAGAICWFAEGVTDSWEESLEVLPCLGFIKGSCCPHYSGEKDRRPSYHRMLRAGKIKPGIAIDDEVAVHYVGTKVHKIVTVRKGAGACWVKMVGEKIREKRLK